MPPTMAAAEMHASSATAQSPLARLANRPKPTLPLQATASKRCRSVGVGRPARAARWAITSRIRRAAQIDNSVANQAMKIAFGRRRAIAPATATVLMAPAANTGREP
ncbi:hypothetical protein [Bradyrhizobium sp. NP1]|uniref:hypothetical protein n=1 Tax=Bradyrhizobium sp. NP1 TaxID=3049772 RepID=UPI00339569CC